MPLFVVWCLYVGTRRFVTPYRVRIVRSAAARRAFRKMNPCPGTGMVKGPCRGYVIDHIMPLACGGEDAPSNMQWQTAQEAKAKDAVERKNCGS
jgi:hypothetical protein